MTFTVLGAIPEGVALFVFWLWCMLDLRSRFHEILEAAETRRAIS